MAKYVFVTGGVTSSLGKGITAASIGRLLKARGLAVSILKLDPYINVDPGTMSPYQHGEVFVTDDGAETDLDLGHYERFIDENLTQLSQRHHRPHLPGGDRQGAPRRLPRRHGPGHPAHHQRDQGADPARRAATATPDVVIVEVGGTVGDIESLPFLEAIRQMRKDVGRANVLYVHVTLLPALAATGELKTKPTQHSVKELRGIGIQPDVIVLRSRPPGQRRDPREDRPLHRRRVEAVIPAETAETIYEVPLLFEEAGLGRAARPRARPRATAAEPDLAAWRALVERIKRPEARARDRPRRQVHRAARRLPLGHRGAQPRRLGARRRRQGPLGRLRGARPTENVARAARRRGRRSSSRAASATAASRARSSPPATPASTRSRTSACAWASSARSSSSPATSLGTRGRQLDRVRHVHRAPGHRLHARPARRGGQGRHDAPRPLPGPPDARLEGRARSTARRSSTSGTATASRSTTATAQTLEAAGMVLSRPVARRPARRDRRAARPPVVRGQPVPPRVQEPARAAAPAVRRVRGGGARPRATAASRSCGRVRGRAKAASGAAPDAPGRHPTSPAGPSPAPDADGRQRAGVRVDLSDRTGTAATVRGVWRQALPAVGARAGPGCRVLVLGPARAGRSASSSRPMPSVRGSPSRLRSAPPRGRSRPGALRGLVALLAAVAAYYLLIRFLGEGFRAIGAAHAATVWGLVAALAGPALGAAGATWRHGRGWPRAISASLLAALFVAEGIAFGSARLLPWDDLAGDPGALPPRGRGPVGLALPAVAAGSRGAPPRLRCARRDLGGRAGRDRARGGHGPGARRPVLRQRSPADRDTDKSLISWR